MISGTSFQSATAAAQITISAGNSDMVFSNISEADVILINFLHSGGGMFTGPEITVTFAPLFDNSLAIA